jgi:putative ABC transport system permease protein
MGNLAQDIRFGLRTLRKNLGFTTVAVLVLAVGIGATTAIFTVINAVLLHPLPYPDSQRLVVLRNGTPQTDQTPLSYPQFLAWREQKDVFEQVAAFTPSGAILTGVGEPEQLVTLRVSSNLLPIMGVNPILGRDFTAEEEPRNADPVAILSYAFWQDRFHSDRSVLGRKITLTDRVYTIVGVLPPNVDFGGRRPTLLTPLRLDAEIAPAGLNFLPVVAKLRSGLNLEQATSALKVALARVKKIESHTEDASITDLQEFTVGSSRPLLFVLLGTVAFVLLIACANIANLLLARGAARGKEIAIRISLGAGRMRLLRQLLTESTLLSLLGGAIGLLLAWQGVGFLKTLLAASLPRSAEIHVDPQVFLFTVVLSLITGMIFGLAPSWQAARSDPQQHLKLGGRQSSAGPASQRFRSALVVAEVVLSLVPLAGAGLLVRSFFRLVNVDKGFNSDHVLTIGISPSPVAYRDPTTEINYLRQIVDNVQGLPGVSAAGFITDLPLGGGSTNGDFQIQGRPSNPNEPFVSNKEFVQGPYFAAMRIPLREGRYFNESDTTGSPKVVVVNETFARKFFPGDNPIGKHIDVAWGDPGWSQIIGVVADARQETLATPIAPVFYALIAQKPELLKFLGFSLAARTQTDPISSLGAIKSRIYQLNANQAIANPQSMDTLVATSLAPRRVPMLLMLLFAAVALFLAAIGIYGVLSYFVLQRRQEIAMRLALGAQRSDVLRMVLGQGAKLVAAGIGLGLLIAFLAARAMASLLSGMLFGVKPGDLPTFVAISFLLALLAMVACAVPALRATQVDPLVVLRNE